MKSNILTFQTRPALDLALAKKIKQIIDLAIQKNGFAVIAFSGGSTPIGMLVQLSQLEVEWGNVKVTLVDDRWVEESHSASNATLLKKYLVNRVKHLRFFSLVNSPSNMTAFEAEKIINKQLELVLSPLDIAVLGMGEDGHTASFFPSSPQLEAALDVDKKQICLATKPTNANHDRMTLSLAFIMKSQNIFLHFTGKVKQRIFSKAICSGFDSSLPVSFVLNQKQTPVTVYYAD